jgi:hypothetical protein
MKKGKPEPITTARICSMCGEAWNRHPENPTVEDCVALLKAELGYERSRAHPVWINPAPMSISPLSPPYPWWGTNTISGTTSNALEASSN